MPLSDIYRIPKSGFGTSTTPSDRGMENGVVELVWENGQIKTHLQSNRSRSSPIHGTPLSVHSVMKLHKDGGNATRLKTGHTESDFSVTVPTSDNIARDDTVDPWFDCPTDDSLHPEYYSDLLPELPQVPLNEFPNPSKLNLQNLESGFSRRSIENADSVRDSAIINFSHFARPSALFKPELQSPGAKEDSNILKNRCNDRGSATSSASPVCSIFNGFNSVERKEIISRTQHNQLVADVSKPGTSFTFPISEGISKQNATVKEPPNEVRCMGFLEEGPNVKKSRDPVTASSSACSGNTVDGAPDDVKYDKKRKLRENEESEGLSDDVEEESIGFKKQVLSRAGTGSRRSRAAEVHNLSERRRRDRINEKMRALQELIPNCNKVDKASMLDEAIEYLKTLQLQVQIMSMGVGYYTAPMMFQPAMQPVQAAQMAHFPRVGLAMGMGLGVGSFEVNGFNPACPTFHSCHTQGGHFSDPACFPRPHAQHNLHALGLQGQGFPLSTLHASAIPLSTCDPAKANIEINAFEAAGIIESNETAPTSTRNVSADVIQDPSCQLRNVHKQMGFQP